MATAADRAIVDKAVKETLQEIQTRAPDEFKQITAEPKKLEELKTTLQTAAEEQVKLSKQFSHGMSHEEIESALGNHLSKDRVELIKQGLTIPTYQMRLNKRPEGHICVDITRDGKEFMPSINLMATGQEGVMDASWIQMASVIVEAVLLVMTAVGIKVSVSEAVMKKTAEEVVSTVESSSILQKAIEQLKEAFKNGSTYDKAKAIFYLIKDTKAAGILWKIIKSLCSNMSTWDWIKTAGIVSAMIIAAVATDGVALIAKIVLALNSAYEFGKKIANLVELEAVKKQ